MFAERVRCAIINIPKLILSQIPDGIDYTVHFTDHALHSLNNLFNLYINIRNAADMLDEKCCVHC